MHGLPFYMPCRNMPCMVAVLYACRNMPCMDCRSICHAVTCHAWIDVLYACRNMPCMDCRSICHAVTCHAWITVLYACRNMPCMDCRSICMPWSQCRIMPFRKLCISHIGMNCSSFFRNLWGVTRCETWKLNTCTSKGDLWNRSYVNRSYVNRSV